MIPSGAFLSLTATTSKGEVFSFARLAQKVTVVINVAEPRSSQNVTPQSLTLFKELGALHNEYRDYGVEILAFPCDQFSGHASDSTRKSGGESTWCERMGFDFHVMQQLDVNGAQEHPVYKVLKRGGPDVRGNFQTSFLVACGKDERCRVSRFDGLPPRALRSRIDELLSELDSEMPQNMLAA
jgi:glutathione peroxidase